jgi:4-hydroxy-4-methyl-2-oxoglutarate aldolase
VSVGLDVAELARLGVATIHEASGKAGLIDIPLTQVIRGSRVAGPARTAACAQGDNLMVHAVMAEALPGEVLVLTMPEPQPVALIGELLATQAAVRDVAGILVDGAVRDLEQLEEMGLPIWARFVRARGAVKDTPGQLNVPVTVGGAEIRPGDLVVLDADGGVVIPIERVAEVEELARAREARELELRAKLEAGALTYDLHGLRAVVDPDA